MCIKPSKGLSLKNNTDQTSKIWLQNIFWGSKTSLDRSSMNYTQWFSIYDFHLFIFISYSYLVILSLFTKSFHQHYICDVYRTISIVKHGIKLNPPKSQFEIQLWRLSLTENLIIMCWECQGSVRAVLNKSCLMIVQYLKYVFPCS